MAHTRQLPILSVTLSVLAGLMSSTVHAQVGNGWWRSENWQVVPPQIQGTRSWNEFRVNPQGGYNETTHEAPLTFLPATVYGFNELRWNVTSRSRVHGTAVVALEWVGEGEPPSELWMMTSSRAVVGALVGQVTLYNADNGMGAPPEFAQTFPWTFESQSSGLSQLPVVNGRVTLELAFDADSHAVPTGPDPSPLVSAARVDMPLLALAQPALVIDSSIEPNTTRGPDGSVIPTPVDDDRHKFGYTHVSKETFGFPATTQYFGQVQFTPKLEGVWQTQAVIDFIAASSPTSVVENNGAYTVRWNFTPTQIGNILANNGTISRNVAASAEDKDGTGEIYLASYEVRFKTPRSIVNASPTTQISLPYMQLRPVQGIPPNTAAVFEFLGVHTMDVYNYISHDTHADTPFLQEFKDQIGLIYSRPMDAFAPISPGFVSSFTVWNTSSTQTRYFHAGRVHKIRVAGVDYARYGQTGFTGDGRADLSLWRSPTAQSVEEYDFEDMVVWVDN